MSVQKAYLDYVRLASWDISDALYLSAALRKTIPKWKPGFWLQYKGHYGDNSFYGSGEQNEKRHWVFRSAGVSSSVLFDLAYPFDNIYCTRLDVQVTIKLPENYDVFKVYENHKYEGEANVTIIDSPTGSTIYFGSRTSNKFARLYEKQYEDGRYLRMEFEVKGKLAKAAYVSLNHPKIGPTAAFQHFMGYFNFYDYIVEWFETGPDAQPLLLEIEHNEDVHKKMSWLSSLSNTVVKMGNDHDMGDFTRRLLSDWQESIDINHE